MKNQMKIFEKYRVHYFANYRIKILAKNSSSKVSFKRTQGRESEKTEGIFYSNRGMFNRHSWTEGHSRVKNFHSPGFLFFLFFSIASISRIYSRHRRTSSMIFTSALTFAHRKLKVDIRVVEKQEGGGYLSRKSSTHARTVISFVAGYFLRRFVCPAGSKKAEESRLRETSRCCEDQRRKSQTNRAFEQIEYA